MGTERIVAVVAGGNFTQLLSLVSSEWELKRYNTASEFRKALSAGDLPVLDGVVFTDITGDSVKEILSATGGAILRRSPVAVVCFKEQSAQAVTDSYDAFEVALTNHFQALQAKGLVKGANPIETTNIHIIPASGGPAQLLRDFGTDLVRPINVPAELPPAFSQPFEAPDSSGFASHATPAPATGGRIVTVISDKGGCGKTSVALMLASSVAFHTAVANQAKKVVVVDLDRQSQLGARFPTAHSNIERLQHDSGIEEIRAALHQHEHYPNLSFLFGGERSGDHLALRTKELYSNILNQLQEYYDLVVVDGSVGTSSDPVTVMAQQMSDGVYYVLDHAVESLRLAQHSYNLTVLPVEDGGVGIAPEKFRVIQNRISTDKSLRKEWESVVNTELPNITTEVVIPAAYAEMEVANSREGGILELCDTSDVLREPLKKLAVSLYPDVVYDTADPVKKKGLFRK